MGNTELREEGKIGNRGVEQQEKEEEEEEGKNGSEKQVK